MRKSITFNLNLDDIEFKVIETIFPIKSSTQQWKQNKDQPTHKYVNNKW